LQKRIFWNFAGLILFCVILLAVSFGVLFFRAAQTHEMAAVRDKAYLVAVFLNQAVLDEPDFELVENIGISQTRITIISAEGWVISDSHEMADLGVNRSDRLEFMLATTYGKGEAIRSSDTLGAETFYYAMLLNDGSILRLSRTLYSLREVFLSTLPALFTITVIILVLAHFTAHRLTQKIIKPLTQVDFESAETIADPHLRDSLYEELWPYIKKIEHQKQEIASQLAIRREFSANVSHELKTPLTTISALSEMMLNGMAKPDDVSMFSEKISNHAKRLMNIINDIIRLSEFDESKVEKDFTKFDVYQLAKSVISALQDKAAQRHIRLELTGPFEATANAPLFIKANSHLLDELMFNLVDNAIKYNKDGGHVTLDLREDKGQCKITVTDTGIGISKEHQHRIFERFYRVDRSRSKKTGGTGLGLSIVKHIIEHHNGNIVLHSTKDKGTTIACYIPTGLTNNV